MSAESSPEAATGKVSLLARLHAWWEGEETDAEDDIASINGEGADRDKSAAGEAAGWPSPRLSAAQTLFGQGCLYPGSSQFADQQLELLQLEDSMLVVDISAGAGAAVRHIADQSGATVQGLESDPVLVELAKQINDQSGQTENATVVEGTLGHNNLEPGTPDVIVGREALLTVADKDAAFLDLWTLLKPGGQALLLEFVSKKQGGADEDAVEWAEFEKVKPQLATVDQIKQGLAASHFDIHQAEDVSAQACSLILRSLAGLAENLKQSDLPKDQRPWIIWEVELWARRVNMLQKGNIGFYRFHASKAKEDAE